MKFVKYDYNKEGHDFVCGDIHGCFDALEVELEKMGFDKSKDRLFCTGDLPDRGPFSSDALRYMKKKWFYTVLGNHEDMILQVYRYKTMAEQIHTNNGGGWIKDITDEMLEMYMDAIEDLPLAIQVGDYGIIHSLIPTHFESWYDFISNIETDKYTLLWHRDPGYSHTVSGIKRVICGHTIVPRVTMSGSMMYIDTGAYLDHWGYTDSKLTILRLPKK